MKLFIIYSGAILALIAISECVNHFRGRKINRGSGCIVAALAVLGAIEAHRLENSAGYGMDAAPAAVISIACVFGLGFMGISWLNWIHTLKADNGENTGSLWDYLESEGIAAGKFRDYEEFYEAEYDAVQEYCWKKKFLISRRDINEITIRGLAKPFYMWREQFIYDLWYQFRAALSDPEAERTESPFLHFPAGTRKEKICRWFEKTYGLSTDSLAAGKPLFP